MRWLRLRYLHPSHVYAHCVTRFTAVARTAHARTVTRFARCSWLFTLVSTRITPRLRTLRSWRLLLIYRFTHARCPAAFTPRTRLRLVCGCGRCGYTHAWLQLRLHLYAVGFVIWLFCLRGCTHATRITLRCHAHAFCWITHSWLVTFLPTRTRTLHVAVTHGLLPHFTAPGCSWFGCATLRLVTQLLRFSCTLRYVWLPTAFTLFTRLDYAVARVGHLQVVRYATDYGLFAVVR